MTSTPTLEIMIPGSMIEKKFGKKFHKTNLTYVYLEKKKDKFIICELIIHAFDDRKMRALNFFFLQNSIAKTKCIGAIPIPCTHDIHLSYVACHCQIF